MKPFLVAISRGVCPNSFRDCRFAPHRRRYSTIFSGCWPASRFDAMCRAVLPSQFFKCTSAPFRSRNSTIWIFAKIKCVCSCETFNSLYKLIKLPCSVANCNGVYEQFSRNVTLIGVLTFAPL